MKIDPQEISSVLKSEIEAFGEDLISTGVGRVIQVGDGIARVYGLTEAMMGELVEFPGGVMGLVLNLEEDNVGCILLGSDREIQEGDTVRTTGRIVEVPVGKALLGRVVNALGQPLDDQGPIAAEETRPIETHAPGVVQRKPVEEPLQTGLKCIDSMTPIGRGQRELIIGDRQTGKTAICIDAIINQKGKDVFCFYVAIGQKLSTVARIYETLKNAGAMEYTTIISATANNPTPEQYLAPYAGCSMGEYFRDSGRHALVVYDDLTKHAQAYREISLLLRRPPGREAYPGDIFYLHAHLLERAAKLNDEHGAGSLTALPIIETQEGDFSAYIPTNVISITDGQIYLESDLFFSGVRPAMNVGLSVSRVGGKAQTKAMKKVGGQLRLDLAYYNDLQAFAQFASELDASTRAQLARGERMIELLKQQQYSPMPIEEQVVVLFAGVNGYVDSLSLEEVRDFETRLLREMREQFPNLLAKIADSGELDDETESELRRAVGEFKERYVAQKGQPESEGEGEK